MTTDIADALTAELQTVCLRSRQLSRAIGQAKKAKQDIDGLVQQKHALTRREDELRQRLSGLLKAPPNSSAVVGREDISAHVSAPSGQEIQSLGSVTVVPFTQDQRAEWDAYVTSRADASVYHLSAWREVCHQAFGHDCPYRVALRGGRIVGVLPLVRLKSRLFGHFLVSIPFFNYGGVLADDGTARQALLDEAVEMVRALGCTHLELRDRQPMEGWPARTNKVSMWLKLPDSRDALWQQIGSKVRAQIKKAHGNGLIFQTGGVDLLDEFYHVFSSNMRDLGTPVYSRSLFEVIFRLGAGDPCIVIGRDRKGAPVAAALLLSHAGQMEIPWASTLRRANALNANMGLYWHVLQHACLQGNHTFDFGRSTKDASTYRFKKQWGALPVPLYWHYGLAGGTELPKLNPDNPKYRLMIAAWKMMPIWLTRIIGPGIVKNIP